MAPCRGRRKHPKATEKHTKATKKPFPPGQNGQKFTPQRPPKLEIREELTWHYGTSNAGFRQAPSACLFAHACFHKDAHASICGVANKLWSHHQQQARCCVWQTQSVGSPSAAGPVAGAADARRHSQGQAYTMGCCSASMMSPSMRHTVSYTASASMRRISSTLRSSARPWK